MFDESRAGRYVKFFENVLTHTKGVWAGKPFLLAPWQAEIVRKVFGTVDRKGRRQYRTVYQEIPKKNGKTELVAGACLAVLILDGEPGCEVYSAASTRKQAKLAFDVACKMVRNSAILRKRLKVIASTHTAIRRDGEGFYQALSAEAGAQDGINPHFVAADELHRWKGEAGRDLYDVLQNGMTTRAQPLMWVTTTAGVKDESPLCWEKHEYALNILAGRFQDKEFLPVVFSNEDDPWDFEGEPARNGKPPTGWYKSNPALGDPDVDPHAFKRVDAVRKLAQDARRMPAQQNSFMRFHQNRWVDQETRWLDMEVWEACSEPFALQDLAGRKCYAGLDLSATQDVTALILLFPFEEGEERFCRVLPFFFLPEEGISERSKRDGVTYDRWAEQGFIELTPGAQVDYGCVREKLKALDNIYEIKEVGHDPWQAVQLCQELSDEGFTMIPISQRMSSLSPACKAFELALGRREVRHDGNPPLSWMANCVEVKQDAAGNIMPVKPDRRKSKKRIDGIAALIDAFDCYIRHRDETSIYETRGVAAY